MNNPTFIFSLLLVSFRITDVFLIRVIKKASLVLAKLAKHWKQCEQCHTCLVAIKLPNQVQGE